MLPKPGEGFYVTRGDSPYREKEEADARARGLTLRELKPVEAQCLAFLAFLTKGPPDMHMPDQQHQHPNGETRARVEASELELELTERLELRCTPVDRARFAEAARARGISESAFVRLAAREHALHPAIARGALEGAWLELAQQGVQALQRSVAELADLGDQFGRVGTRLESLPNVQEIAAQLRAGLAPQPPRAKKLQPKKQPLKLKYRDAPGRPGKKR